MGLRRDQVDIILAKLDKAQTRSLYQFVFQPKA
jgi:hypothetical protein